MLRDPFVAVVVAAVLLRGQDPEPGPQTPEQQLQAKLAQPFLQRAEWTTDWDTARQRAAERGRLILGYFTTAGP